MLENKNEYKLYEDISLRTGGEIYIGITGPVRTGKSTFIKNFMKQLVLPNIEKEYERDLAVDELPQSAAGKTITTTEPKFIPKEAVSISLGADVKIKVRLVDCVGFMINGVSGHLEDDVERMVKTPWYEEEIPFTKAAEIGTRKVMQNHATIGIAVLTDGSFLGIDAKQYEEAQDKTIRELKNTGKPFLVLLNCVEPNSKAVKDLQQELENKYGVTVLPVNCETLKEQDIKSILMSILYEFPISSVSIYLPKWFDSLDMSEPMKQDMVNCVRKNMHELKRVKDIEQYKASCVCDYINDLKIDKIDLSDGTVQIQMILDDKYYYEMLSKILGMQITEEVEFMDALKELAASRAICNQIGTALEQVKGKGYGVIMPQKDEIVLAEPEIIKQGVKYGVKIKAESPSIHLIRANIETEIAPIVGTRKQAEDLITYIKSDKKENQSIWDTNIFGKTVEQLVQDGMQTKIAMINEESQEKLQETMQKIVNDSNGGMVCIII